MIQHHNLIDFIEITQKNNIDFPRYAYECGACQFIEHGTKRDWKTEKFIHTYKFKNFYLEDSNFSYNPVYPYQVLSIPDKSYLMYKIEEEIFIWVCYTETSCRGKGYMTMLLKYLKNHYPDKEIIIDTLNQNLRRSCEKIDIGLFEI